MLAPLRGRLRRSLTGSMPRAVLNLAGAGKRPFNRTEKHAFGHLVAQMVVYLPVLLVVYLLAQMLVLIGLAGGVLRVCFFDRPRH